ncbi:alpha/beta hydrolase fold domain-containing protein [Streptomyces sp. SudanB182_2057]|uniref:alpha/beta hydrolase fold domain-containing protein n=1 Tax=Streptomyces sp. SudanB182_2057 TaxID=3035281 RepID=UPI003F56707E
MPSEDPMQEEVVSQDAPSFPAQLPAPPDPARLPLPPPARPEPGVRLLRGAVYAVPDGSRPLETDLWLPEPADGPLPVVVFVHGGGWRTGLRDDPGPRFRHWRPGPFARLAGSGVAVVCPDYRLSGEARHPAQLDDLRALLVWLRDRAGELGLDPDRVVLWGESAGGHLAALTALTRAAAGTGGPAVTVRGCVTWYAPTDLTRLAEDHPPGRFDPWDAASREALLLGAAPAAAPGPARDASPALRVTPAAPPFLLLHGTEDELVPCAQSDRLAAALRAAGVPVEQVRVPGANHLWLGLAEEEVERVFARTAGFVARHCARETEGQEDNPLGIRSSEEP